MKKLRLILPALALVFAIVATYASSSLEYDLHSARGITLESDCAVHQLDQDRIIGTSIGQCYYQDDYNGVCTVSFPGEFTTTAYDPNRPCVSIFSLYIQD